jgi:HEAT repeat protein
MLILAACLLAVAAGPGFVQDKSADKSPGKSPDRSPPAPPKEVGGKTLEQWIDLIKARRDPSVREMAIRTVPYFGKPAAAAVPALLDILQNDRDGSCRVHACLTLYYISDHVADDDVPKAVRVLSERVTEDPQAIVRFHAVLAAGAFGTKAVAAIPSLVGRIHDPSSWELRRAVVASLGAIAVDKRNGPDGRAVMAIASLLLNAEEPEKSGQVRMEAVMALGEMGRPAGDKEFQLAAQALQKSLKDPDKPVQIWAAAAQMKIDGVTAKKLSDLVNNHLKGKDSNSKFHAARALLALRNEPETRAHIPDIIDLLDDKDPIVVANAIEVLVGFGTDAKGAIPALRRVAERKDQLDYFKQAAKAAIDQINGVKPTANGGELVSTGGASSPGKPYDAPPDEIGGKTLKQWLEEIKSGDPSVRETAIRAVPYFGKPSRAAAPALIDLLKKSGRRYDRDASCRVHACLSLWALAGAGHVEEVREAVDALTACVDGDPQAIVRYYAVSALGAFGPKASSAVPSLVNRIHDPSSWEVRRAVVATLRLIGSDEKLPPDPRAVAAISNLLLNSESPEKSGEVRMEAVMALGAMGRPVNNKEFLLAVQALKKSASPNSEPDKPVQIWSRVALMAVDKVTKEGLDEVARYLTSKDVQARVHAARALAAMGKEAKGKVPDIIKLLDDKDPMVVGNVIEVLSDLGPLAQEAVGPLQKLADKPEQTDYFKQAAKAAIEKINKK